MEGKKKKERKREEKNGRTFSRDLDTAPKLEDDDDDDTPSVSFRPPRSFDHGGLDCLIVPPPNQCHGTL